MPSPPGAPSQIEVTNPSDGGFFHWLFKLYAFAFLGAIAVALFGLVGVYI
jgi:hypothetical protein